MGLQSKDQVANSAPGNTMVSPNINNTDDPLRPARRNLAIFDLFDRELAQRGGG
jgi:hypothetical protein